MSVLANLPLIVITVAIKYRFSHRILGRRYSWVVTFLVMVVVHVFAGWMNLFWHLAADMENTLYYGLIDLALYLCFFKGSIIKKIFLVVLINCGFPTTFYIFLPFANYFFWQETELFLLSLKILESINVLLCAIGLEYVGKKFQNLRRELPVDYTLYLTVVIIFVNVAIYSAYDRIFMINESVLSLPAVFILAAFAVSGMAIVMIAIFAVDRQVNVSLRGQLQAMQAENFKSRELEWRKFSKFRHDIKNHLICLNNLLENDKAALAVAYMGNLTNTVKQFDSVVQTGNDYADALLNVKYAKAVEAKIAVSIEMAIPSQGFIEPVDLCCILSNAFDNAIAACNRLTEGEKWITANAFIKQGQFIIVIKNSKPDYVTVVNGEVFPKEISAGHGLGIDIVRAVVQKYNGVLNLSAADAFSFSVLLPPRQL